MEPHEILTLVRRFTPLLLAHLVLGAIVGYSIAYFSPPVYTSKASALVAADGNGTQSVSSSSTLISAVMPTLVQLGTSQPVLDDVAASTGVDPSEVSHAITVTNPPNTLLIEVSAEASSPEKAQMIAQAEIKALRKVVGDMSVKVQEEAAPAPAQPEQEEQPATQAEQTSASSEQEAAPAPAPAPAQSSADSIAALAMQYVGSPYVWGASGPSAFDCSGLVSYVYGQFGTSLPHSSEGIRSAGTVISAAEAQPGDVIWWSGHVAIYVGDGMMVSAESESVGVQYLPVRSGGTFLRM